MSAHLQFGPEWMRKGPGKTSNPAAASASDAVSPTQESAQPALSPTSASTNAKGSGMGGNRKHPSLGKLSASTTSSGPTPLPAATIPSPGAFSFAAAAQGGGGGGSGTANAHTASSSSATPHSSEGDSVRYSKRLLSLYSTERGGKASAGANQTDSQRPASPGVGQRKKPPILNSAGGEARRSASVLVEGAHAPQAQSPNGEPRGLNARTISASLDKSGGGHRPGLFQRGSSSTNIPATALSPTMMQSREARDRHGTGIQGGVLSGVAAPLSARKQKDSEGISDAARLPQSSMDSDYRTNDAFTSARNRSTRTTHDEAGLSSLTGTSSSGADIIETWSRFGGRRERLAGEGPIGPPADHSGGFAKFAGYDRKRERQTSTTGPKRSSETNDGNNGRKLDGQQSGDTQVSSDVDLSKHATYVLDSLQLDDDDEEGAMSVEQPALPDSLTKSVDWSPERQDWFYRDPSGQLQGPFKAVMMQEWYNANYFSYDLLVRRAEEDVFESLGDKLVAIGNAITPFFVSPSAYARTLAESKTEPQREQAAATYQDHSMGVQPNQQSSNPIGTLGWPGNIDVLSHLGGGHDSGRSSPFATPQGHFAELDHSQRLRSRMQQEQYAEMLRQRDLADQRVFQEQRAAQMAAIAMAQAQGRDPASLGLWGPRSMLANDWNQVQSSPAFIHGDDRRLQNSQVSDTFGPRDHEQAAWAPQQYAHTPVPEQQQQAEQGASVQKEPRDAAEQETRYQVTQGFPIEETGGEPAREQHEQLDEEQGKREQQTEYSAVQEVSHVVEEEAVVEESQSAREQAPEEAWPQSPTAVEFASEPLMAEEQWSKEESPSRGKKSRRERAKQRVEQDGKHEQQQATREAGVTSGSVKTVGEEQFRRSQAGPKDTTTTSQAPLSSWLPDTPGGGTPTKAAPWANNQQDGSGLSLREIQEAEARQAEIRKAARQRLQASATAAIVPSTESALPTTMSWGLASSIPHSANGRDSSSTASNTPVWNARQAPKKTLMEIQEEERSRAQKIKDSQAAQMASKSKAYADSASKMQSSPMASGPAANWSVVGASGKPTLPGAASASASRGVKAAANPIAQRTASSSSSASPAWNTAVPNGPPPSATRPQTPRKAAALSSSSDASPAPSTEFIRHCKEQLKGLSVKVDDFIEMLLSFPLDPSPEVVEIIAESVYASSSTLDGRRFAADFVSKRKLDAGQNRNGPSAQSVKSSSLTHGLVNGHAHPTRSASDVLKSAPASDDAFGGFKVVKAKGAKKRA